MLVFNLTSKIRSSNRGRPARAVRSITLTLLAIEFLDELVFGVESAVLPSIRTELALTYAQIGLLLSLPRIVATAIEPALGVLGDTRHRKILIVGGGLLFALALMLTASGQSFAALMIAFAIFNPASGAFVSLSQATLMDLYPTGHEKMMARWTLAGALGVVAGPALVSATLAWAVGWRELFALLAGFTLILVWLTWRRLTIGRTPVGGATSFRSGIGLAWRALRNRRVLRWLVLLESADLLLDVLLGFIALYFVDVLRATEAQAALAVAVWSAASLIGDALIIPVLERVRSLSYLRWSALVTLVAYGALLLTKNLHIQYVLLACLGLSVSGWYAILKGQLYTALPGQSGIAMTVSSLSGIVGGLIPWGIGILANQAGLSVAMILLVLGPISLIIGLPRAEREGSNVTGGTIE